MADTAKDPSQPEPAPKKKKQMQLTISEMAAAKKAADKPKAFKGMDLSTLMQLQIPDSVMREGILFIWVEKELISSIMEHFETQGFLYVENVAYVMLNKAKQKGKLKTRN